MRFQNGESKIDARLHLFCAAFPDFTIEIPRKCEVGIDVQRSRRGLN